MDENLLGGFVDCRRVRHLFIFPTSAELTNDLGSG